MRYRVGIGYDIHRLVDGRKLFLGGVEIPFVKGLLGHSDADVLLHAICDALLGAAGQADIGEQFPDTDERYAGISSILLLKHVAELIEVNKFKIDSIDCVVIAQQPCLSPFKQQMRCRIAEALRIPDGCVSVKAKTNEGMGEVGGNEAIASFAVAMLSREE